MYNPSDVGKKGTLFGLPYAIEDSDLVILPVELDVTVSYGEGTSNAPKKILDESAQLDLSVPGYERPWELKLALAESMPFAEKNNSIRTQASEVISALETGSEPAKEQLDKVNEFCVRVHEEVQEVSSKYLAEGRIVAVLGGDHSSPLGLIKSLSEKQQFGILQVDAHMDLRESYEGFDYSHASIMYNALKCKGVISLTQVGIRDYCEEEEAFIKNSNKAVHTFFDEAMFRQRQEGQNWKEQVLQIIETLPEHVYISFDIDGLDPSLCPNTGTPVPGGSSFNQAVFLIEGVVTSGRKIVGFDLCEVGDGSWDANVGARILYRLCLATGRSQKLF